MSPSAACKRLLTHGFVCATKGSLFGLIKSPLRTQYTTQRVIMCRIVARKSGVSYSESRSTKAWVFCRVLSALFGYCDSVFEGG